MDLCDNLTYVGLAFMTLGMLTGSYLGERSLGTLLGLGPEKKHGQRRLGLLIWHISISDWESERTSGIGYFIGLFCLITNVLVWNQLSSVRTRSQCTYV